jgi:hypothetical protein
MSIMQAVVAAAGAPGITLISNSYEAFNDVTFSPTVPAGTVAGTQIWAVGLQRSDDFMLSDPSGFTKPLNANIVGANGGAYVAVKDPASGTESGLNFTWDDDSGSVFTFYTLTGAAVGAVGGIEGIVVPSYTFPAGGGITLAITLNRGNSDIPATPAGWTSIGAADNCDGRSSRGHRAAYRKWGPGASGNVTFTGNDNDRITVYAHLIPAT